MTEECDKVSWATWVYVSGLPCMKRQTMLLIGHNPQKAAAVKRAGSSVVFVNYDTYVSRFNGRFCEPGVDKSLPRKATLGGRHFQPSSMKSTC